MFEPLYKWRLKETLSQKEAAAMIGVTQSVYSKYERGENRPGPDISERIVSVTGGAVTYADIYGPRPTPEQNHITP